MESVRRWWKAAGRDEYPQARRLLITADAGGSNGYRTRAWKAELAALAVETGLEITVCHFPPGTSKWNKVEHRLFSHITMNWRGRPLTSHEVVVQHHRRDHHPHRAEGPRRAGRQHLRHRRQGQRPADGRPAADPPRLARRLELHPPPRGIRPGRRHPRPVRPAQPRPGLALPPGADRAAGRRVGRPDHHADDAARPAAGGQPGQAPRPPPPAQRAPGTGRRPVLTLADRLLATILHYRLALPQVAIAALFGVRPETVNKRIRDIRQLLDQAGHTIQPGPHRLASLDDLYDLARSTGIAIQPEIKTAC